jgi:hypothetical protein
MNKKEIIPNNLIRATVKGYLQEFPELDESIFGEDYILAFGQDMHEYNVLYEGLTITSDIYTSRNVIIRKFGFTDDQLIIDKNKNIIRLNIKNFNNIIPKCNFTELLQLFNNLGWQPSMIAYTNINDMHGKIIKHKYSEFEFNSVFDIKNWKSIYDILIIQFNAKFDIEIDVPGKIYHISPMFNRNKILKLGLLPKSKNALMLYENRIYFLLNNDKFKIQALAEKLYKYIPQKTKNIFKSRNIPIGFDIYEITTNNIVNQRWFKDPNLPDAVYCLMNINPMYIKLINTISINNI